MKIRYCDGGRLRRTLLAATEHLASFREELDRINVFPVPDGDTGTNLTLTMRSVADALRPLRSRSAGEVAAVAADACVLGARGNSGMLVAHYLAGFSRAVGDRARIGIAEVAEALGAGAESLERALEEPVEGTIVTVTRETARVASEHVPGFGDLVPWLREVREAARRELAATRQALPALRDAGVVDAGARGFVELLDGVLLFVEGRPLGSDRDGSAAAPVQMPAVSEGEEGRYCTQLAYRGTELPGSDVMRGRLRELGTSVIVLRSGDLVKVHLHADDPATVEDRLSDLGEPVSRRIEDTWSVPVGRTVAVVTDSSADLPEQWLADHGVEVVPLQVIVGERTFRDREEIGPEEVVELLRRRDGPRPTTSQAAPGAFVRGYRRALERGGADQLLGIFLSGAVSGTLGSARAAAERIDLSPEDRRVMDSRTGSLGLGMLVVRAVELLDGGASLGEAAAEVERIRDRSSLFFAVEDLEGLRRSGRVSRGRAWLGNLFGFTPVLTLDRQGRVIPHARVRGREAARERVMHDLERALAGARRYRVGVVHAGVPEFAAEVEAEIRGRWQPVDLRVRPLTAVIAAHLGPGAWGVCYQIEDRPDEE